MVNKSLTEDDGYRLGACLGHERGRQGSTLPELTEDDGYRLGAWLGLEGGGRGQPFPEFRG